jgi:GDPmannose 4,6-dehydratase
MKRLERNNHNLERKINMEKKKIAIIFGVSGQDGSYLSELLLSKQYTVIGVTRRSATDNTQNLSFLLANPNFKLVEGDVTDSFCIAGLINEYKPDEIYNLAAQSHVGTSFSQPGLTWDITAKGCLNILEAIRHSQTLKVIKFYQASSSEMFGKNYSTIFDNFLAADPNEITGDELEPKHKGKYQDEETPFSPQSPYAIAKLSAHHLCRNYRDSYGIFASSGILFNHESPRRGENFVTRKITKWIGEYTKWNKGHFFSGKPCIDRSDPDLLKAVSPPDGQKINTSINSLRIHTEECCKFPKLRLGNLDAKRDWGFAGDYVEAMWSMLQHEEADDFVIATGETYSVRDFLDEAFKCIGITDWSDLVVIDPKFYRPAEVDYLLGDPSKAKEKLGWESKTPFSELVKMMVEGDLDG